MATPFQKRIKEIASNHGDLDKIVCRANGNVEIKRGYFYRHGSSAEKWAGRVDEWVSEAGIDAVEQGRDDWAAWPKGSYFVAVVMPKVQ